MSRALPARTIPVTTGLGLLLLASAAVSLGLGNPAAGFTEVVAAARGALAEPARTILLEVRLPRIALAGLVGASLATAGAAFQAVLRNPLADPFILGVSGGAALGAVLWTALGGGALALGLGQPVAAFTGAMATLALLFALTRAGGRTRSVTLLLVGVVLNAFFSAAILFLLTAGDASRTRDLFFVLVGTIHKSLLTWPVLAGLTVLVAAGIGTLLAAAHRLNLLSLGEETASHLGVRVERTTWGILAAASLVTAAAVAFSGIVGFVGLIVPHMLRAVFGADHRVLVPGCALGGAAFLIAADTGARTLLQPVELPVGVITAMVGGPFFLVLLWRRLRASGA